ncbi:PadR family transcriptional regulator [Virgibacillus dakarensis]|uniref:PadR family transcriptional regulator n=1 Tax=Lentibacillus populi TaxID=1827502 RepID=A0A9W5U072_9BACI|nr:MULTISPECIES: PadR family transcriptional regulator [Bacillaceae]MBT2217030.1 PadR family transcriptional regulator [Virgibacillus dakarensis]MTW86906.1 PadR family transcriptional regulator [Virgibacillus dakarensis]GGB52379.1 PadR family transcriptional regulator [Lentibacillus populi]
MSVKHSLLALLYEKPSHGYELKTGFDELVQSMWPLNAGQVYTTLDRLERDNLVESPGHDKKDRKLYTITEQGKKELWNWLKNPVERSLLKDEFYFKYLCASHVDYQEKQNMIQVQKQTIIKDVLHLTQFKKQMNQAGNQTMKLLVEGALLHLEADIKWLDMIAKD